MLLYLIVIIIFICLWFLLSGAFKYIGKFFYRIGKDALDELNEESED